MKAFVAASACALALLVAGTASAEDYRIAFGDLDLGTPQGATQFDRRVNRAARGACNAGSPLDQARCTVLFRSEARSRLPDAHRDAYARARADRATL